MLKSTSPHLIDALGPGPLKNLYPCIHDCVNIKSDTELIITPIYPNYFKGLIPILFAINDFPCNAICNMCVSGPKF